MNSRVPTHVQSIKDSEGAVLLDVKQGKYFSLNATAAEVWHMLEAGTPADEMARRLAEVHDVDPQDAENDIRDLLGTLGRLGLLE